MGKGTLRIKFRDSHVLQLSGMQVEDVHSDLCQCKTLWDLRRTNQVLAAVRVVVCVAL